MAPQLTTGTLSPSPFTKQPWRGVYLTYQLLTTAFVRFPLWTLYLSFPSRRPVRRWTLRRSLRQRLLKHLIYVVTQSGPLIRYSDHLAVSKDTGVKGVWIPPAPKLLTKQLKAWADAATVECTRIPGYWLERGGPTSAYVAPPAPGEKVVFALHGGAYIRQSAHPRDPTSNIPHGIMRHSLTVRRCLTLEYRLSKLSAPPGTSSNPFPAALIDAIAGYRYLVQDVGFDPEDIVVEGDSAGGNLALALVRYLVENQDRNDVKIPAPPGRLLLNSPWVDLSGSDYKPGGSLSTNSSTDYLVITPTHSSRVRDAFLGPQGPAGGAATNPYISPAAQTPELQDVSFVGFPRTFITAGGCEVLRDQIRVLNDRMTSDLGKEVVYHEMPDAIHDVLVFTWFKPERSEALQRIASWIDS